MAKNVIFFEVKVLSYKAWTKSALHLSVPKD